MKPTKQQIECKHGEWEHVVDKHENIRQQGALWLIHRCKACKLACMPQLVVLLEGGK